MSSPLFIRDFHKLPLIVRRGKAFKFLEDPAEIVDVFKTQLRRDLFDRSVCGTHFCFRVLDPNRIAIPHNGAACDFSENPVGIVEIQVKFLSNALSGDGLRIIQKCSNAVAVKA